MIKYYPFILLTLMLRESGKLFVPVCVVSLLGLCIFLNVYLPEIQASIENIPKGVPFGDMFGAINLPLGVYAITLNQSVSVARTAHMAAASAVVMYIVLTVIILGLWRTSDIQGGLRRLDESHSLSLIAGCLLLTGCFFAGQSVGYRGIFLLLVMPGLQKLGQDRTAGIVSHAARFASIAIVPLMWCEAIRFWGHSLVTGRPPPTGFRSVMTNPLDFAFWCLKEFTWWSLIGLLSSILLGFIMNGPVVQRAGKWLARSRTASRV